MECFKKYTIILEELYDDEMNNWSVSKLDDNEMNNWSVHFIT